MTIKKMLLLAVSAMALVAFAIPAAAGADQWYTSDSPNPDILIGGLEEEDEIHLQGTLTATLGGPMSGTKFICEFTMNTDVWNEGGAAKGSVTNLAILAPAEGCIGSFAGGALTCELTEGSAQGGTIHVATGATGIAITNFGFVWILEGCAATEIAGASGTLTGTWNNSTSCLDFSEDGDLLAGTTPVLFDGSLCDTTSNLTLH